MEPLAPGTEEDTPRNFPTKQDRERDRLLCLKGYWSDGSYGPIFEFTFNNNIERWYCNICQCPVMGFVFHHEQGRRHNTLIQSNHNKFHYNNKQFDERARPSYQQHSKENSETKRWMSGESDKAESGGSIKVAPGEPLPPGFDNGGQDDDDGCQRRVEIQDKLDAFTVGPLVGLEYLLELRNVDPIREPGYICLLCDKRGDPRTVITHLASYKHLLTYLQMHFAASYRAITPFMSKERKRGWQQAVHSIAEAIEKQFGRLKPMSVEAKNFEEDRMTYLRKIHAGKHFSERMGHTFEELINIEELSRPDDDHSTDDYSLQQQSVIADKDAKKKSPSPPIVKNPIQKIRNLTQKSDDTKSNNNVPKIGGRTTTRPNSRSSLSPISNTSSNNGGDAIGNRRSLRDDPHDSSKDSNSKDKRLPSSRPRRSRSPLNRNQAASRDRRRSRSRSRDRGGDRNRRRSHDRTSLPWERSNYRRPRSRSRSRSPIRSDKRRSPPRSTRKDLSKEDEFTKLCKAIDTDMERTLTQHKRNPEKHPQYNEEWKKFWNQRYKELQLGGVDVSKHDFKPEWIEFWTNRMKELHAEEVKSRKKALRRRLGLDPEEPIAPISFKIGAFAKKDTPVGKTTPITALSDNESDVIIIDDLPESQQKPKRSRSPVPKLKRLSPERRAPRNRTRSKSIERKRIRSRSRSVERKRIRRSMERRSARSRSRSPKHTFVYERPSVRHSQLESHHLRDPADIGSSRLVSSHFYERPPVDRHLMHNSLMSDSNAPPSISPWVRSRRPDYVDYYKPPAVMRDVTREPVLSPLNSRVPPPISPPNIEDEIDGNINVVAILRLLTALEERLGSLGPKVIDLMAQALAMEKNDANSSETLLDNELNCVLFETVKEKLKGQLLAGLVEPHQERVFRNAIKKTANLIHAAELRKREKEKLLRLIPDPVKLAAASCSGSGPVDKAIIARQIASALVAQGKTDVSQAELEQLINAVVGMAEASRKRVNNPSSTTGFLAQLPGRQSISKPNFDLMHNVTEPSVKPRIPPFEPNSGNMDNLTDTDMQTLLQNFKDLSTEEQHHLISYLKKLEVREPDRVERLRKFVNLGGPPKSNLPLGSVSGSITNNQQRPTNIPNPDIYTLDDDDDFEGENEGGNSFSFKNTASSSNTNKKHVSDDSKFMVNVSDEEDDYTFEDVAKAASNNVKQRELEHGRRIVEETMRNMKQQSSLNQNDQYSSADFAQTIKNLPVNISNLANIMGSVQSMQHRQHSLQQKPSLPALNSTPQFKPQVDAPPFLRNSNQQGSQNLGIHPKSQLNFEPPPPRQSGISGPSMGQIPLNTENIRVPPFGGAGGSSGSAGAMLFERNSGLNRAVNNPMNKVSTPFASANISGSVRPYLERNENNLERTNMMQGIQSRGTTNMMQISQPRAPTNLMQQGVQPPGPAPLNMDLGNMQSYGWTPQMVRPPSIQNSQNRGFNWP